MSNVAFEFAGAKLSASDLEPKYRDKIIAKLKSELATFSEAQVDGLHFMFTGVFIENMQSFPRRGRMRSASPLASWSFPICCRMRHPASLAGHAGMGVRGSSRRAGPDNCRDRLNFDNERLVPTGTNESHQVIRVDARAFGLHQRVKVHE